MDVESYNLAREFTQREADNVREELTSQIEYLQRQIYDLENAIEQLRRNIDAS